jgi:hypothetical protein
MDWITGKTEIKSSTVVISDYTQNPRSGRVYECYRDMAPTEEGHYLG